MDPLRRLAPLILLLLCHASNCGAASGHDWSYDDTKDSGPSNWHRRFPGCAGRFQSPVDICHAEDSPHLPPLVLGGYDRPLKHAILFNNGHTVNLKDTKSVNATLSGGCLDGLYYLDSVHFHWGQDDLAGSEHTIHGRAFSMEGHLVHWKKRYGSLERAKNYPDGVAVLGVFYQSEEVNASRLSPLIRAVQEVSTRSIQDKVKVDPDLTLRSLLPDDVDTFYCYRNGSLTTPDCREAVVWTLLDKPVHVGKNQLKVFRRLRTDDGLPLVNNFRRVQPLHGRTIYFRSGAFRRPDCGGSTASVQRKSGLYGGQTRRYQRT